MSTKDKNIWAYRPWKYLKTYYSKAYDVLSTVITPNHPSKLTDEDTAAQRKT